MFDVRVAANGDERDAALDLAERVWGARPISPPLLRALEFAGMYLAIAVEDDDLIGMCAGFVGVDHDGLHLHSHLAAVDDAHRGRGIGRALKRHQRRWSLDHGIDTVTWTFDPLVVANARFNIHHLGAVGDRYLVNLYGAMDDSINRGDESDRLLVRWDLRSEATLDALDRPIPPAVVGADASWVLSDVDGEPVPGAPGAGPRLVAVPRDIVAVRSADPGRARRWRTAVRDALVAGFADGLRPTALTADLAYVLTP